MNQYEYSGPVLEFNTCTVNNWKASTYAISKNKARSNLAYQYKKRNNKITSVKITLPGKLVLVQ